MDERLPDGAPAPERIGSLIRVETIERDGRILRYYGRPSVPIDRLETAVADAFRGYDVSVRRVSGESPPRVALEAQPRDGGLDGIPWLNLILFALTVVSTLFAGSQWYYTDLQSPLDLLAAWPFTAALLGILGVHEFGHYLASRYHGVDASLPYFIPVPSFIGTLGAVIRIRGPIPDREALFDIGASGPLAGFVATIGVAVIGLAMDPITVPESVAQASASIEIELGYPLVHHLLALGFGAEQTGAFLGRQHHPILLASWVGALVTMLNLLPVGQLDGGHVSRAVFGPRQETVGALVPAGLFGLAAVVYTTTDVGVGGVSIWIVWGVLTIIVGAVGPATPIHDTELGPRRRAVAVVVMLVGIACVMPVPMQIVG
ncbi:MAG: site-2 protease family protein [Halococcoides sp.]